LGVAARWLLVCFPYLADEERRRTKGPAGLGNGGRGGGGSTPGTDRTEVLCAVSRLVVVRQVGAASVRCVYSRPGASPQCRVVGYSMWRSSGQAQAGAPAVPSTVRSTDISGTTVTETNQQPARSNSQRTSASNSTTTHTQPARLTRPYPLPPTPYLRGGRTTSSHLLVLHSPASSGPLLLTGAPSCGGEQVGAGTKGQQVGRDACGFVAGSCCWELMFAVGLFSLPLYRDTFAIAAAATSTSPPKAAAAAAGLASWPFWRLSLASGRRGGLGPVGVSLVGASASGAWWGPGGGDVVVEFLSAAPRTNLKEQKQNVRENGPRTSYNGRTELIRGIHLDRIMKA
jgi:hypothetical protein